MRMLIHALLLMLVGMPAAGADEAEHYNRIQLAAVASEQVANDTMHVSLDSWGEHRDPAKLTDQINADMEWALSLVKPHAAVAARTGNYQIWPLPSKDRTVTRGWRGQQQLQLESSDSKTLGELVGQLQERLKISSMNFTVSDELREVVENRLITEALEAFKARARIVSENLQARQYRIVSLNIGSSAQVPPIRYQPRMAMTAEADTAVATESGESEVSVSVNGTIELVMP